jgi:DNA-binding transcriptional ArsR family regulator
MGYETVFAAVRDHPVYQIAGRLERYVGVSCDIVHLMTLMSMASGCIVSPLSLDVCSSSLTADLYVANRILDLLRSRVERVDTTRQFRRLERRGFPGLVTVLVRGRNRSMFSDLTEYTARLLHDDARLPSLIRISEHSPDSYPTPATLRLLTTLISRDLDDFAHSHAVFQTKTEGRELTEFLERLPVQPDYSCRFRSQYRGLLKSDNMLILEKLLLTLASIRIHFSPPPRGSQEILPLDYHAVRTLLTSEGVCPIARSLSPRSLDFAETIYDAIHVANYQLTLPDHSCEGSKWFRRLEATKWTGLGYTSVKHHLMELEKEGLVRPTIAISDRTRGREIHFRFIDSAVPPFGSTNPFDLLPMIGASDSG